MSSRRTRPPEPLCIPFTFNGSERKLLIWQSRPVGLGSFGEILRGEISSDRPGGRAELVAVKRFMPIAMQGDYEFIYREMDAWSAVNHRHILPFYGDCDLGLAQFGLVSPLCQKGNLKNFIAKYPRANRLTLICQVADAMRYLHVSVGIVHGDLKCENVLISDDNYALLADFGLSTLVERTDTPTATFIRRCSTACFAAPELLDDAAFNDANATPDQKPRSKTQHSDSFAFGRFIYEAYMGEAPWRGATTDMVRGHVLAGGIPPRTVANPLCLQMSDSLWQLCLRCWNMDAFARPDATTICHALTSPPELPDKLEAARVE